MARASVYTLLSLDRFAKIMQIPGLHFNGGDQINLADGRILFPIGNAQKSIWPQYEYQNADQISREELARQIATCEAEIAGFLGFYPAPDWSVCERHELPNYHRQEIAGNCPDVRYNKIGIQPKFKKFINGGRRNVTYIDNIRVAYSDPDGDGFDELASIVVDLSGHTYTDIYEIKVYFENHNGEREWEIRDSKSYDLVGTLLTITFPSWQLFDPDLWESLPTDDTNGKSIDPLDGANYVLNVDVYREFNDTTQNHVEYIYIDPTTSDQTRYGGFLYQKSYDGNYIIPVRADYTNGAWVSSCLENFCKIVDIWYYSGNSDTSQPRSNYLNNSMATAIAYMTVARLERCYAGNTNIEAVAENLRVDYTLGGGGIYRRMTSQMESCPFGTMRGEIEAWRLIKQVFGQKVSACAI